IHDLDCLLGVVDRDVDVHPEDELPTRDVLQLVDEVAVPVARGDALALEQRERMRPGRADPHPVRSRDVADVAADLAELLLDVGRRPADRRRDLEHGLHELRVDACLELVAVHGGEHRVDVLDEVEGLAVEEHVLPLHAERVRIALAERVVEDAAAGREARALPGDRGRIDLLRHVGRTASASISTRQRGSTSAETASIVLAGRISPKNSPCARPTSSQSATSVRKIRVRTTFSSVAPASSSAVAMIWRHRRARPEAAFGSSSPPGLTGGGAAPDPTVPSPAPPEDPTKL